MKEKIDNIFKSLCVISFFFVLIGVFGAIWGENHWFWFRFFLTASICTFIFYHMGQPSKKK